MRGPFGTPAGFKPHVLPVRGEFHERGACIGTEHCTGLSPELRRAFQPALRALIVLHENISAPSRCSSWRYCGRKNFNQWNKTASCGRRSLSSKRRCKCMPRQHAARVARDTDGSAVSPVVYDVDGREPELRPHTREVAGRILVIKTSNQTAVAVFALIKKKIQRQPLNVSDHDGRGPISPERRIPRSVSFRYGGFSVARAPPITHSRQTTNPLRKNRCRGQPSRTT